MKLLFTSVAWANYVQWKRNLTGWWSRRITREHRLVYRVVGKGEAQALQLLSCRYHY